MVRWRPPSAISLVPKLLLVPMLFLNFPHPIHSLPTSFASSDAAATCAEDLMALFSGPKRASNLSISRATELKSCIRPLVPYHEIRGASWTRRRKLQQDSSSVEDLMEVNARLVSGVEGLEEKVARLVQWPPESMLSLARKAVAFGGGGARGGVE